MPNDPKASDEKLIAPQGRFVTALPDPDGGLGWWSNCRVGIPSGVPVRPMNFTTLRRSASVSYRQARALCLTQQRPITEAE